MNTQPAISIQGLTKQYAGTNKPSLSNLNVQVNSGEVYGFLGPNGAGKSTTIRTLMNFLQPTKGTAHILGLDIVNDSVAIKRHVGYLSGDFDIYHKMTGSQYIDYLSDLQGDTDKKYAKDIAQRLQAVMNRRVGSLSRGQKQKIGIIQAFMHKPNILILDEPSSGLDPLMQEMFYELINEAKHRGAAVFISSHIMSEVQKVCDRVGIIRSGKLIAERTIADLSKEASQTFDVTFADKPPLAELKKISGLTVTHQHHNQVAITMKGDLQQFFKLLGMQKILSFDTRTLDLEDTFLHYYQNGGTK
jgi:ABC-2 type transport system ATP-binding protein